MKTNCEKLFKNYPTKNLETIEILTNFDNQNFALSAFFFLKYDYVYLKTLYFQVPYFCQLNFN